MKSMGGATGRISTGLEGSFPLLCLILPRLFSSCVFSPEVTMERFCLPNGINLFLWPYLVFVPGFFSGH